MYRTRHTNVAESSLSWVHKLLMYGSCHIQLDSLSNRFATKRLSKYWLSCITGQDHRTELPSIKAFHESFPLRKYTTLGTCYPGTGIITSYAIIKFSRFPTSSLQVCLSVFFFLVPSILISENIVIKKYQTKHKPLLKRNMVACKP